MKPIHGVFIALLFWGGIAREKSQAFTAPGPAWFSENLVYYNACEDKTPAAVNTVRAKETLPGHLEIVKEGMVGNAFFLPGESDALMTLESEKYSPHRPLTISFWWALPEDHVENEGFGLVRLQGKNRSSIGHFARGGPWSGLERTAGILQIHNFPQITNVSLKYDRTLSETLSLKVGVWHHTALVFTRASTVQVYTDGCLTVELTAQGRNFTAEDELHMISFGPNILIDEIAILDRVLDATGIASYYEAMRNLREYERVIRGTNLTGEISSINYIVSHEAFLPSSSFLPFEAGIFSGGGSYRHWHRQFCGAGHDGVDDHIHAGFERFPAGRDFAEYLPCCGRQTTEHRICGFADGGPLAGF